MTCAKLTNDGLLSFQARIGNMDGVIVAYHNTARMFGFQYIPLEEMDQRLFGSAPGIGDRVFDKCVGLMERVADEVVECFPKQVRAAFFLFFPWLTVMGCRV